MLTAQKAIRWIANHRNENGGFVSTQVKQQLFFNKKYHMFCKTPTQCCEICSDVVQNGYFGVSNIFNFLVLILLSNSLKTSISQLFCYVSQRPYNSLFLT